MTTIYRRTHGDINDGCYKLWLNLGGGIFFGFILGLYVAKENEALVYGYIICNLIAAGILDYYLVKDDLKTDNENHTKFELGCMYFWKLFKALNYLSIPMAFVFAAIKNIFF